MKHLYDSGEGIDLNQKSDDNSANTALHVAARAGHHQIVLYLLQVSCGILPSLAVVAFLLLSVTETLILRFIL